MLVNAKNQPVQISDKLNSKTHPQVFAKLTEHLVPTEPFSAKMFKLETRASEGHERR